MMVDLGNSIISQYRSRPAQTVPGIFDFATDNAIDGTIIFDFVTSAQPTSITLIDIDDNAGANVRLYDAMGNVRPYVVPDEWTGDLPDGDSGYGDLDLTTLGDQAAILATASEDGGFKPVRITRLEVQLIRSGGVHNLALMTVPEPASLIGLLWASVAAVRFIRRPIV